MTAETWATLVTSVVVPLLVRALVHYFPWLADPPRTRDTPPDTSGDVSGGGGSTSGGVSHAP